VFFYCCKDNNISLKYKEIKRIFFNKKDVSKNFFPAAGTFDLPEKERGGYGKNRKK